MIREQAHPPRRRNAGFAIVSLLVILAVLTVLSLGLMVFSTTEIQISDNQKNHAGALYVTEAGIAEAVARLELPLGTMVNVNGGNFDASIGDDPYNPDPDWRTEIYLSDPGSLPAPVGAETVVATVQPGTSWIPYGDAGQGLDPIIIEHKWADLNIDGIRDLNELVRYDAHLFPPENFASGQVIEVIRSSGILNGSRREIRAEVIRIPITVNVTAAISSDNGVDLTGNMAGCGHNHDLFTPAGTKNPACQGFELCAGRTLDSVAGCLVSVMTTGDEAETGGASDLEGFPSWSDTSSTNAFFSVEEYLGLTTSAWEDIRDNADYSSANDAANMDGIVVVNHDATAGETFNGNVGTGLIYVNGDMDISGNFEWRGLIYVEGNCTVTGTVWILGAIVVRGTTATDAFAAGNSTVLYSRDAISMFVGNQLEYQTLAWNEL